MNGFTTGGSVCQEPDLLVSALKRDRPSGHATQSSPPRDFSGTEGCICRTNSMSPSLTTILPTALSAGYHDSVEKTPGTKTPPRLKDDPSKARRTECRTSTEIGWGQEYVCMLSPFLSTICYPTTEPRRMGPEEGQLGVLQGRKDFK
ncbi:hypothetical protein EYF80_001514 [Liparis tanakae]|uniref:Uncharacterized protein n=1 Tax=Liparis tanakae TaxID=230148 RepID=A0A4Z2JFA0_9TELE|nr:hypothetical protein EYF80_001514 [Liparis tanakae]